MSKPTTHDEYLAALGDEQRQALQRLRDLVRSAAPDAEERIGYGIPIFWQGRPLVGYGAARRHCALYLMSSTVLDRFEAATEGLDASKGTLRFDPAHPLPESLVAALVAARLAENAEGGRR
jgi:uncharacterized protein YdhG (YjbR/CyaY superfamily)